MLPPGTTLYDLTVAEDHSFVIEGVIAHNSRCRCAWIIEEDASGWTCTWETEQDDAVCDGCLSRGAMYGPSSPLKFPKPYDEQLQEAA